MITLLPHHTQRLTLRTLRASDIDAFLAYRSRADVAELQGWSPMSEEEAFDFLHKENSDVPLEPDSWRQIGIATLSGDALVGDIGIHMSADQRSAEFGISVNPDHQGLGLGTEAVLSLLSLLFQHTPVHQIIAVTDARNIPCIRLLEKSGMRHTLTRRAEYKGEQCVEFVFTSCRSEG